MESSIILLALIKVIVSIYDIISLPIYLIIQKPWRCWGSQKFSAYTRPGDPTSPVVSTLPAREAPLGHHTTYTELMKSVFKEHRDKQSLGYRALIHTEQITTSTGKSVTKKLLDNKYTWITYGEADQRIECIAKGLKSIGVQPGDKVVILMETRFEWQLVSQAIIRMGATLGTLYSTLGQQGIRHGVTELEAKVVVTSSDLVKTVMSIAPDISGTVSHVVVVGSDPKSPTTPLPGNGNNNQLDPDDQQNKTPKVVTLESLEITGANDQSPLDYKNGPEDVALILYTSGSSGLPKGVVIKQKQFVAAYRAMSAVFDHFGYTNEDTYLAYLPLAHVFEFMLEFLSMTYTIRIGYGAPLTLTNGAPLLVAGCPGDAVVLKPTAIPMVPLLLDRIKSTIMSKVRKQGPFQTDLFEFAVTYKDSWTEKGWRTPILDKLVFKKARAALGGQLKHMIVGAAPLSPDTQRFIRNCLNVALLQGYGASETLAIGTCMIPEDFSFGRTGAPVKRTQLKLVAWEEGGYTPADSPHPRGEIFIGGQHICEGYYKRPEESAEAISVDPQDPELRWFASGDIGELFPDGTLKIVDRKKDLVKLQNGEYISLGKVEATLMASPFIDNICVFGDSFHNYIVALILPNRIELRKSVFDNDQSTDIKDMCRSPKANKAISESLFEIGRQYGLGRLEIPSKIYVADNEWTPASGLVTATMKIRRKQLIEYYKEQIREMYK